MNPIDYQSAATRKAPRARTNRWLLIGTAALIVALALSRYLGNVRKERRCAQMQEAHQGRMRVIADDHKRILEEGAKANKLAADELRERVLGNNRKRTVEEDFELNHLRMARQEREEVERLKKIVKEAIEESKQN
jgi:hypothetical protein